MAAIKGVFEKILLIFCLFNKNLLLTMILSWLAETDRNIHSWLYSIIGEHSQAYSGTVDTECFIGKCHSLSNYIMIAKPFLATTPFIRIDILNLQGQELQVFSSNLTISNYNFEFIPVYYTFILGQVFLYSRYLGGEFWVICLESWRGT